jgi:thiamine transport system ATP-binding protein
VSGSELLRVRGLSSAWAGTPVLKDVSFEVGEREFLALMGPNGSGKTTLLRLIAGLEAPTSGSVSLRGVALERVPAHRRGVGLLFQDSELFPNRTVWENIAYGPEIQRRPAAVVESTVQDLLGLLHLNALADRHPGELSGGERQRTALARALAPGPGLVLLDEPFASVDPELRRELRAEFRRVLAERGTAAILVTHDRDEGLFLGDRVAVLLDGRLRQSGRPAEVYDHPRDEGVARFLGYNILTEGRLAVGVLPDAMEFSAEGGDGIAAEVMAVGWSPQGPTILVRAAGGPVWEMAPGASTPVPEVGARIRVRWQRAVRFGTH